MLIPSTSGVQQSSSEFILINVYRTVALSLSENAIRSFVIYIHVFQEILRRKQRTRYRHWLKTKSLRKT